jgi:hypothetical protein
LTFVLVNDKCKGSYAACVSFKNSSFISYGFASDLAIKKVKLGHYQLAYDLLDSSTSVACPSNSKATINLLCPRARIGVSLWPLSISYSYFELILRFLNHRIRNRYFRHSRNATTKSTGTRRARVASKSTSPPRTPVSSTIRKRTSTSILPA